MDHAHTLGLQPYLQKVVRLPKLTPTTFSGGSWSFRDTWSTDEDVVKLDGRHIWRHQQNPCKSRHHRGDHSWPMVNARRLHDFKTYPGIHTHAAHAVIVSCSRASVGQSRRIVQLGSASSMPWHASSDQIYIHHFCLARVEQTQNPNLFLGLVKRDRKDLTKPTDMEHNIYIYITQSTPMKTLSLATS